MQLVQRIFLGALFIDGSFFAVLGSTKGMPFACI